MQSLIQFINQMNKQDRKALHVAVGLIDQAREIIEGIMMDEQEKFDNLSEGLQQSAMGQKIEEGVSTLEGVIDSVDEVLEGINTAIE